MKNTLIICILLVVSIGIPRKSLALIQKHKEIVKAKFSVCTVSNNTKIDSIANYAININGKQNSVTIKTDSLTVKTSESILNKSKDSNTIEINGESNSVSVNQETKGKIGVKQSGNNNTVKIVQSSHQP